MRWLALALFFGTAVYGDDIVLPVDHGNIVISPHFIRETDSGYAVPELSLTLRNQTSSPWKVITLEFEIGALCNGEAQQWTVPVSTSLGWSEDHEIVREFNQTVISLVGKIQGCKTMLNAPTDVKVNSDGVTYVADSTTAGKGVILIFLSGANGNVPPTFYNSPGAITGIGLVP